MSDRIENDVVAIRGRLDYPGRETFPWLAASEALDRLASDAHECERLRAAIQEALTKSTLDGCRDPLIEALGDAEADDA